MNSFSIFDKSLHEMSVDDLLVLRNTAEGWYVEYKERCNDMDAAAKSLSAFANSYGGWLFYGITENKDETRTAGGFPGIAANDVTKIEEWLQQAARTRIAPSPFFEHRVFLGPHSVAGLADERAIIAVRVPMGNNPPYVHANGRIYRRIADASDPKSETDRHLLDLLWQRSKQRRQEFADYVQRKLPSYSPEEQLVGYVRLFFLPDPWNERGIRSTLSFERFRDIMIASNSEEPTIPLDNFFTMSNGFVARQTKNNNPYYRVLTWQQYSDLTTEVIIPLTSFAIAPYAELSRVLNGYDQTSDFIKLCNESKLTLGYVIDLSQLYLFLRCLLMRLSRIHDAEKLKTPLYVKSNITGIWRRVPFIDLPAFGDHIRTCGIPVIQEEQCFAPSGIDPDSCLELKPESHFEENVSEHITEHERRVVVSALHAMYIIWVIGRALALPTSVFGFGEEMSEEQASRAFAAFSAMEKRASEVKSRIAEEFGRFLSRSQHPN